MLIGSFSVLMICIFRLYFHKSIGCGVQQGLIQIPCSDHLETKSCVAATDSAVAKTPVHAIQAFKYLKESPAAQVRFNLFVSC